MGSKKGTKSLYRLDTTCNEVYGAVIEGCGGPVKASFAIPIEGCDDLFLCGCLRCLYIVRWDRVCEVATAETTVACLDTPDETIVHWGKCDPNGVLYFSTLQYALCAGPAIVTVSSLDFSSGCPEIIWKIPHLTLTNGFVWNFNEVVPNNFYLNNDCIGSTMAWNWDENTGYFSKQLEKRTFSLEYSIC